MSSRYLCVNAPYSICMILGPEVLVAFTNCTRVMSIVSLFDEGEKEPIIAEGRYLCTPGPEMAEVVFIVDESYQSRGIATFLYLMLVRLARERK
jgi:hypothetical protein